MLNVQKCMRLLSPRYSISSSIRSANSKISTSFSVSSISAVARVFASGRSFLFELVPSFLTDIALSSVLSVEAVLFYDARDAVGIVGLGYDVGDGFDLGTRIAHRYAQPRRLYHRDIVEAVAEGYRFRNIYAVMRRDTLERNALVRALCKALDHRRP